MVCRKVYKKMTYGITIGRSLLPYTGSIIRLRISGVYPLCLNVTRYNTFRRQTLYIYYMRRADKSQYIFDKKIKLKVHFQKKGVSNEKNG